MNITDKLDSWPERARIAVRLHLYDSSQRHRCDLYKLVRIFALAEQHGVQEQISTNLNRHNAVYVNLDNYVLRHRNHACARKSGWGEHWAFLLALTKEFPNNVYIDPPEGTEDFDKGTRFAIGPSGEVAKETETWDAV